MLSRQTVIILGLIGLTLLMLGYLTYTIADRRAAENSDAAKTLGNNDSAEYTSLAGNEVSLDSFEGSVRVVNSWASWSPFSANELRDLNRLGEAYQDRGVNIIAINRNEDSIRAKRYIDGLGELGFVNFLIDGDDAFYARMDGKAMPETLFFDRKGNIIMHARGDLSYGEMERYVRQALGE